jgi:hypothetical protein
VRLLQEEAKILVASEEDSSRQLLETRISKDDGYQKQQGTRVSRCTLAMADNCRHAHCVDRAEWHRHGP